MTREELNAFINGYKKGTITRIGYVSMPKLTAAAKEAGVKLQKVTEMNARFGINYNNIAKVIEKKNAESNKRSDIKPREWAVTTVPNWVKTHKDSNEDYLIVDTVANSWSKSYYILNGKKVPANVVMQYIVPSSQTAKERPVMINVKLNSVFKLGK